MHTRTHTHTRGMIRFVIVGESLFVCVNLCECVHVCILYTLYYMCVRIVSVCIYIGMVCVGVCWLVLVCVSVSVINVCECMGLYMFVSVCV